MAENWTTAEQERDRHKRDMGEDLGKVYNVLCNEVSWLHASWEQYRHLFAKSERRIGLLNEAAGYFFRMIQLTVFEDVVLGLARLTDPIHTGGGQAPHENLTLNLLPSLVSDDKLRDELKNLVGAAEVACAIPRVWRNKRLAHRDLAVALATVADPLAGISRDDVEVALAAFRALLNKLERHYWDSEVYYHGLGVPTEALPSAWLFGMIRGQRIGKVATPKAANCKMSAKRIQSKEINMTVRASRRVQPALRRCFRNRWVPAQCYAFSAILAISVPSSLAQNVVDDFDSPRAGCENTGGIFTDDGVNTNCCWPDWGCLECSSTDNNDCLMECDTALCCSAEDFFGQDDPLTGCDSVPRFGDPVIGQFQPGDTLVAVDEDGQITIVGDEGRIFQIGDRLVVEDDAGVFTHIGDVIGQYTPIGTTAEIYATVKPDAQDEGQEPQVDTGICGAGMAVSMLMSFLGLVGMSGTQRVGRTRRSAGIR